jgi:hypothetical protein
LCTAREIERAKGVEGRIERFIASGGEQENAPMTVSQLRPLRQVGEIQPWQITTGILVWRVENSPRHRHARITADQMWPRFDDPDARR